MLRRSVALFARGRGGSLKESDLLLGKFSLTESTAKPKRNNRDYEDSTTALSTNKLSQKAELELMKECIKGLKEVFMGIEDDHHR